MTQLQLSPDSALALPLALAVLYSLTSFTFAQCLLSLCLSLLPSRSCLLGAFFTNARHDNEGDEHKMKSMETIERIFTTLRLRTVVRLSVRAISKLPQAICPLSAAALVALFVLN